MQFSKSKTRYMFRLSFFQSAKQMKALPRYYVWVIAGKHLKGCYNYHKKCEALHKATTDLYKRIPAGVKRFMVSLYIKQDNPHIKHIQHQLAQRKDLRQVLTLYFKSHYMSAMIHAKPLKEQSHKIGNSTVMRLNKRFKRRHIDVSVMPIGKAKGVHGKYTAEAPRLDIHTIKDALLFFPNGNNFQTINEYVSGHHFTYRQHLRFRDKKPLTADIYRTSRLITQQCRNGALRIAFHAVPAEDKTALETNKQLYHDKRGFWVNTFGLDGDKDKIQNTEFYKLIGNWSSRWNNVTVSKTRGHETGSLEPYHGTKITTIGKYTQKTGVPEKDIRHIMKKVVPHYAQYAEGFVPASVLKEHHLMSRPDAIFNCHFPADEKTHEVALNSEKFQELYLYAYKLAKLHQKRSRKSGFAIHVNKRELSAFRGSLPYKLTRDQIGAVKDILYDLKKPYQMARLLQGDVGSGKTVVAAFAILAVISAGYQAAIMIPTTVLGGQHYQTFTSMFRGLGIHIGLLTGKTSSHDKRIILKKLAIGDIDLIIGTEALYTSRTKYKKLGLVVIDEQHRFGVHQRKALENKTQGCNVLSMTATPIPRTLATAMYNAMDVSQIRTMPKGRKPIITKWLYSKQATPTYLRREIMKRVKEGGQTFVIAKLVKKSHNPKMKDVSNAKETYQKIQSILAGTNIHAALITGQMEDSDKNKILAGFSNDKYQVLVATSVVEVGVDIPKANNMIILDSDRYGLAQLHQLRGRVGRNSLQAYCLLVADPKTDTGKERMQVMEKNTSGFRVADEDLKLRGGGNIFGSAQHGLPDFPLADLSNADDVQLLQIAQQDVARAIRKGPIRN